MDGILNFNKPTGWSSHRVVSCVRKWTRQRRVGHAGTLDPLASGVLLICLGQATRVAEYLMASDKVYLARLCLGVTTDTYDATGQVTGTGEVRVDEATLRAALERFVGLIEQVPPMYSALKHGGRPLYQLARRGVQVERAARRVHIYSIVLTRLEGPELTIQVHCSSGTYIRSLAHDIGQVLGCGAHLVALVRQASGSFRLEQAITPDQFEAAVSEGHWHELVYPLDAALQSLPAVTLDAETAQRVRYGQAVTLALPPGARCRAYDPDGNLVAVMVPRGEAWRPDKVFKR